ncbi:MAG: amidohydrolase [Acidobacteria bacterium]|nr:amidohydrolase [Acidobacteriota bacterium]
MLRSCSCSIHPVAGAHLGAAVPTVSSVIEPAHHGRRRSSTDRAELLVVGRIVTNDPSMPTAEAMAVAGGSIIGLGSRADLEGLTDARTRTVAPDGVIIPGLIEPHMHIWTSLLNLDWADMSHATCPTFDASVAMVKDLAARTPDGQFVLGKLFDPSLYPGETVLTRDILDQVAPHNPVIVMNASMHFVYANSAALAAAGIDDSVVDPPGGRFGRVDGRLDGVVGEASAMMMLVGALPRPTEQDLADGIRRILRTAASRGVTSLREAATGTLAGVGELALLHRLNGVERLAVRVSTAQFSVMSGRSPAEVAAAWADAGVTPFSGDEMVRADAWKVVTDGSNQGRSGYFTQPYLGETAGGRANWTPETLREVLSVGIDAGWQLMIHTNGDAAIEFALTALEELLPAEGGADLRHRLEHCSFATDDHLTRMAALGVSPSFLMNHVYYWGAAFRDTILGPTRADRLDRVASACAAGLRPSLHSDYNVTEINPLQSARTAVLRRTQTDDTVLNPAECATPAQALAAITTHAAWQIHADDRGSLAVGRRADWAVASADPWSSDPEGWADITFTETCIDGTPAWQA